MKKILVIILVIVLISIMTILVLNKNKTENDKDNAVGPTIVANIENIEYNVDKYSNLTKKKSDNGYLVYSSGQVIQYDNIKNKRNVIKSIKRDEINKILNLANKIDENNFFTKSTNVAVSSGTIITIYNSQNKPIIIKDFYNTNCSDGVEDIIKILQRENILGSNFNINEI